MVFLIYHFIVEADLKDQPVLDHDQVDKFLAYGSIMIFLFCAQFLVFVINTIYQLKKTFKGN